VTPKLAEYRRWMERYTELMNSIFARRATPTALGDALSALHSALAALENPTTVEERRTLVHALVDYSDMFTGKIEGPEADAQHKLRARRQAFDVAAELASDDPIRAEAAVKLGMALLASDFVRAAELIRDGLRVLESGHDVSPSWLINARDFGAEHPHTVEAELYDHRAEARCFFAPPKAAEILVGDAECTGESAEMELTRLRERHDQDVSRSTVVVLGIEHADQRAADEHACGGRAHHHHTVRRESAKFDVGFRQRLRQRQVESFHRPQNNRHCLRIPNFVDLDRCGATPRHPISSRTSARTLAHECGIHLSARVRLAGIGTMAAEYALYLVSPGSARELLARLVGSPDETDAELDRGRARVGLISLAVWRLPEPTGERISTDFGISATVGIGFRLDVDHVDDAFQEMLHLVRTIIDTEAGDCALVSPGETAILRRKNGKRSLSKQVPWDATDLAILGDDWSLE